MHGTGRETAKMPSKTEDTVHISSVTGSLASLVQYDLNLPITFLRTVLLKSRRPRPFHVRGKGLGLTMMRKCPAPRNAVRSLM